MSSSAARTSLFAGAPGPRRRTSRWITIRWPGIRAADWGCSLGSPVRLGSSLQPRATTRRANEKHNSRG
eukprot:15456193-Alexandrium_andersonii.AAC.1